MTRPLSEIKAAAKAGEPLAPEEEDIVIADVERQSEEFNAKVVDLEERRAIQHEAPFRRIGEGRYILEKPEAGIVLEVDRLRRESGALVGELVVRSTLPGALTFGGILSAGDVNLSSVRARAERGKYLASRARVEGEGVDFVGMLEELSQRVIAEERAGSPAVLLRDLPRPAPDDAVVVDGLPLLRRHPVTLFGDGGAAKSYLALYLAGRLDELGHSVGLFDWELAGEDHRDRLERLFGRDMPGVVYARCSKPLVHEADRLRRIVQDHRLDFAIFDSVAFACDGPPEAAEVAGRYFQALRGLGDLGTLHVAHITKGEGSDQKPFGSTFWFNGSRSLWFVKLAEGMPGSNAVTIALYNRKNNLGPLRGAIGFRITFGEDSTTFKRTDVADVPELAERLPLRQRLAYALRGGSMTIADLADELEVKPDSVKKTVERGLGRLFTRTVGPDGVFTIGLLERRPS